MRKNIKLVVLILIINILVTACSGSKPGEKDGPQVRSPRAASADKKDLGEAYSVRDYFPFKENTLYEYKGVGDEFAKQKTYMEFIADDRAQMKISNPGMDLVKVLEYRDGEISEVYSEGNFNHIENKLDARGKVESIVLKEPLQVGTSWSISGGRKRSITSVSSDIDLPYGRLKAIEVTTELGEKRRQLDYYSLNLGHVASIYKDGDFEVKTLLNKIHRGPISHKVRYFYPLEDGTGMIYKDRKLDFNTNDNIENILEEGMRNPENETLTPLISKLVDIKSIEMDRTNNILKVDFNKQLIKDNLEMGSFLENELVQAIVNTLGTYYETNKVFISVEGRPYESGHMLLEDGEYFETTEDAIKIVD